jgi:uncharacterized membrane protein YphA (DoxX/SURF4 family)
MTKLANSTDCSRRSIVTYWVTTVIIAAEFAIGGVMDILRLPPFFEILRHLGYPGYFSVILGVWKVLGAAAVLAPRFPRLKEWAYAGMFFNMTGAAASHLAAGDPALMLVAPIIFTGLVVASWILRPSDRRDDFAGSASSSRSRTIAYWFSTVLLALECGVGGVSTTILRHHEAPGLPAFLHDDNRRLVLPGWAGRFGPTLSQAQRVGLRRAGFYLHRSDRLPPGSG